MNETKGTLSPQHQQLVTASGITPEVAAERGYRSVEKKAELQQLGFPQAQRNPPGLLHPIWESTAISRATSSARISRVSRTTRW